MRALYEHLRSTTADVIQCVDNSIIEVRKSGFFSVHTKCK